jgi:hypothetical protein
VKDNRKAFCTCFCMVAVATVSFAQKVEVGYDKSTDFSKYKTYTRAEPAMPPTRPSNRNRCDGEVHTRGIPLRAKRAEGCNP